MPKTAKQSNFALTMNNTGGYCPFRLDSLQTSEVCPIMSPNIRVYFPQERNDNKARNVGNKQYHYTNRGKLQYRGLVRGESDRIPAQSRKNVQEQSAPDPNQPDLSKQRKMLNKTAGICGWPICILPIRRHWTSLLWEKWVRSKIR